MLLHKIITGNSQGCGNLSTPFIVQLVLNFGITCSFLKLFVLNKEETFHQTILYIHHTTVGEIRELPHMPHRALPPGDVPHPVPTHQEKNF